MFFKKHDTDLDILPPPPPFPNVSLDDLGSDDTSEKVIKDKKHFKHPLNKDLVNLEEQLKDFDKKRSTKDFIAPHKKEIERYNDKSADFIKEDMLHESKEKHKQAKQSRKPEIKKEKINVAPSPKETMVDQDIRNLDKELSSLKKPKKQGLFHKLFLSKQEKLALKEKRKQEKLDRRERKLQERLEKKLEVKSQKDIIPKEVIKPEKRVRKSRKEKILDEMDELSFAHGEISKAIDDIKKPESLDKPSFKEPITDQEVGSSKEKKGIPPSPPEEKLSAPPIPPKEEKENVETIIHKLHDARKALMDLKTKEAKDIYLEIMQIYLKLTSEDQLFVYNQIKELYDERKTAEGLA